jgi:hypothetical protein
MEQIWAALIGAVVGGLIAFGAAEWSFRRARGIAAAEANRKDLAILEGLITEIEVAIEIAARASTTPLPTAYLNDSMPLRTSMAPAQASALQGYAYAALRYNGRVARIVAYGMGKRAAGKAPGSERPEEHGKEVARAGHLAADQLRELVERRTGR